ncbi:MAG TPA: choice-of-anchor D domain-containing protein, partial [Candidatus Kapabacteria bacterium]
MAALTFAALFILVPTANAQWAPWKSTTPRDTVFVPAYYASGVPPWKAAHFAASSCVQTKFYFSGTFGIFPGEDSTGLDARYMYNDPSWNAPLPLLNPATWEQTQYNVYLQICNNQNPIDADSVHVIETRFQPNHVYSAIYPSEGVPFQFRIYNRNSAKPDGSYYRQATGGITVRSAQYTAGIAVEYNSLSFPTTNVGTVSSQLDSIASYGLDPLQVDSVWISGTNAADFTLSSQRGLRFTLDSVSGNAFTVSYQPGQPNVHSQAFLNLQCPNADCGHRLVSIALSGYSVAPNGSIGPLAIDFGTVPVNSYNQASTSVSDSGSATYQIINLSMAGPDAAAFPVVSKVVPFSVPPGTTVPFTFSFQPTAARTYHATALLTDNENHLTFITLTGTGAAAHMIARDTTLEFGTMFSGDDTTVVDTITNNGTATARVVLDTLQCNDPLWFSYDPPITNFYLDAGDSRVYHITFHPNTKTNTTLTACLTFYFDDGSIPLMIGLNGAEKIRQVKYDSNHVDFGTVEIGSPQGYDLGLRNLASTKVGIHSSLPKTASPFAEFYNNPTDSTFDSGSHSWDFLFHPFFHGPIGEWAYMTCSTGQLDSIYLSGVGAEPEPDFTPPLVDFGVRNDGTVNYGSTTLTDTGDYPLSVCSYEIVGPDASEFSFLNPITTPYTVADSGKGSLLFSINFTTNVHAGRLHTASLVVNFCDGTSDTIPLRAKEASLSVQFCWDEVDFGTMRIRSTRDTGVCLRSKESIPQQVDSLWTSPIGAPFVSASGSATVS